MPMWTCNFSECRKPAVRNLGVGNLGDCVLCKRHLCSDHLLAPFHTCPKWEDDDKYDSAFRTAVTEELLSLINKINTAALVARASHLRGGIACSVPSLRYDRKQMSSVMGGMNYHVPVRFDDGIEWIARIRRFNVTSPPPDLRDYIIQSEVATLKLLERTTVPAPKVFDFALQGVDNPVGVGYILMEKLPGKALQWHIPSPEQKEKVMRQFSDIFVELQKYPFDLLGSLVDVEDTRVGGFAREMLTDFVGSEMRTMGPFKSWDEYHKTSIQFILDLILREELFSQHAVDAYLIHRFLLDLVPLVSPQSSQDEKKFYLKHGDDKGDHILVDDDYNITGIIDWEWAHTAPAAYAFKSPIGFLPVNEFYDGANHLGSDETTFVGILEEKGHADLADFVRKGRLQHRFTFCCGYDLADWKGFLGLFQGLRDAVKIDDGLGWEEWKLTALRRYQDDSGLQSLLVRDGT